MNRRISVSKMLISTVLTLSLSFTVAAQQITGSIRGTVTDPAGATVPGASVSAIQIETGLTRTTVTDRSGEYVLLELPVGHYRLQAAAKGFQSYIQQGIMLDVNETATIPVRLVVGTETQKIEVQADAQLIQTTVTSLGKTVSERDVLELPLNGRNFSELGLLQPGVAPLTPGLREAGGSLRDGQAYAVNGQRPESNNFLIDGANNFNGVDGGFVLKPPVDAITEFKILTHNANAEFGNALGSTTNIITRSGGNQFHGSLWEFLRNDAFDATNYFASSVEPLKQNQFGGRFGGPIVKDKTFFFGYYEGFRNHQGETIQSTVPSVLERNGDFSKICSAFDPQSGFCLDTDSTGQPIHQLFNVFLNKPYPFNKMPLTPPDTSPLSLGLLSLFPLPNAGDNLYSSTQIFTQSSDQFGVRLDQQLSAADTLNFRYAYSNGSQFNPIPTSGASVPGFPVGQEQRAQNFVATETHSFSPSMIGVARFSFLRNKFLYGERTNHTTPESLGFQYQPSLDLAVGPPFIQVNGYTTIGDPITGPRNTYENAYDYNGSLSWVRGRHELKFGGGYEHIHVNMLQGIATNGFFVFVPFPNVPNAFASFLFGQPVFFLQGRGDFNRGIDGQSFNAYAQDTYKVNSRVTLNYGLRYEMPSPYTEIHNRQTLFIPGRQSTVMPTAHPGLLYPGDRGVPGGLIPTFRKGFAPRVGIALDPTGKGNWLVTSSYGIFYEPYYTGQGGPLQSPISAPPYLQTAQISSPPPNFEDPFNGNPPAPGTFATPLTNLTLTPNLPLPYSQDWDLNVEHSFGSDLLLEVGYVGTKGTKLPRFIEGNPAIYVPGIDPTTGQAISNPNNADQRRLYSGCTLADDPATCIFSSTGLIAGIANSSYNALEASLHKRFSHGMAFLLSYTFSKSIDDASSFNMTGSAAKPVAGENDLAQDPFNLAAERGRSLFDSRHRLALSYQWAIPLWQRPHGWYQHILGAWQLNGIATVMTGTPFTVFDSTDVSQQGGAPEITGFSANRPNLVAGQNPNAGPKTTTAWLNRAAFQQITPNPLSPVQQFGTAGRNIAQGSGYADWDFSAFKNILVTEGKEFQFRAEFFNFLNHTNFRLPDSDISSPTFNQILAAQPPRLIQLALKFQF
ncbi:MAG TPA: carboxypeptidase regulatory-like domain-containing protein [Candidatus Sulfotelmatobacter sp.]|nr:carboxypeptidase regulatory-like domain-containing protein [Candidatus Sulfotelmatobacter sp.]